MCVCGFANICNLSSVISMPSMVNFLGFLHNRNKTRSCKNRIDNEITYQMSE